MQIREVERFTGKLFEPRSNLSTTVPGDGDGYIVYAVGKDVYHQLKGEELLSGKTYNIVLIEEPEVSFIATMMIRYVAYPDDYTTSVRTMVRNIVRIEFFPPI